MKSLSKGKLTALVAGDVFSFALITVFGFSSHDELIPRAAARMLATFFPFLGAWLLIAPWMGLFGPAAGNAATLVWRTPLAAVLAAPLGAWLRGLVLTSPIILPVFVLVMAAVSALGLTAWRLAAWVVIFRKQPE